MPLERSLELKIADEDDVKYCTCDGCGKAWVIGDKIIQGIESCCGGGCSRAICEDCVTWASLMIAREKGVQ